MVLHHHAPNTIADETKEGTQAIQASDVVTPLHAHANMSHSAGAASIPETPKVVETYNLSYLFDDHLDAMENFQGLMQMCLGNNNPHAKGLEHLKQSIDGRCNYGTYIYGLLMISRVSMAEGKRYL
ncbi:hypothetical protein DY000_02041585 [Brassica cretica]|nr:hypothetical protein DY000_02041585 [Brassica cretica]